eukprot:TRINITY_DN1604_c0_g1_i3.p2 TRINITY_DN1604_c0_g1~~TRINITY_DN1604_c0_g1_i3.p2  ORF type:complete len:66 (-),score=11.11 TRINITY_DN1604_c0_g1_i3:249-446(-)
MGRCPAVEDLGKEECRQKPIEVGISDDMLNDLKVEIQDLEADRKECTKKLKAMRKESQKINGRAW